MGVMTTAQAMEELVMVVQMALEIEITNQSEETTEVIQAINGDKPSMLDHRNPEIAICQRPNLQAIKPTGVERKDREEEVLMLGHGVKQVKLVAMVRCREAVEVMVPELKIWMVKQAH